MPAVSYRMPLLLKLSRNITPPRALVVSFALLIAAGTALLKLPGCTGPDGISWIDSLFTATSAVCVTGLVVVDTGTAFSLPGQAVILAMIQLGGLGLMTFSVFFLRLVGRNVSLRDELAVRDSLSYTPTHDISELVRSAILYALTIEGLGALLLFINWSRDFPPLQALWLAVFHSTSAFCNAGFALWPDSLTRFRNDLGVNLIFIALIITGGLGFIVIRELAGLFRRKRRYRLSLHTKIVLWTTLILLAGGTAAFLTLEWHNLLAGMSLNDKLGISIFQAVTPRTAGFNTVEFAHLTNATLMMTMILMFIGGSPGSTAGGVKTISLALIAGLAVSRFRGFTQVNLFRRRVPSEIVSRAFTIVLGAIVVIIAALTLLMITETGDVDHTQTRDIFMQLMFETVSAFGTVGLSLGETPNLSVWGKLIIIMTMFLGRVGPLTAALALMKRSAQGKNYHYGSEQVMVG